MSVHLVFNSRKNVSVIIGVTSSLVFSTCKNNVIVIIAVSSSLVFNSRKNNVRVIIAVSSSLVFNSRKNNVIVIKLSVHLLSSVGLNTCNNIVRVIITVTCLGLNTTTPLEFVNVENYNGLFLSLNSQISGAVCKSRWPSWDFRPNEPYEFP